MKQVFLLAAAGLLLSQETVLQHLQPQLQNNRMSPVATQPASGSTAKTAVALVAGKVQQLPGLDYRSRQLAAQAQTPADARPNTATQQAEHMPPAEGSQVPADGVKAIMHFLKSNYQLLIAHPAIIAVFVVAPNQRDIVPVAPNYKRHASPV